MADPELRIHFVWVNADWPTGSPMRSPGSVSENAFDVDGADSRQPGVSLATRTVSPGTDLQAALQGHLAQWALARLGERNASAAVFGRRGRPRQGLYMDDRIELLGPLTADPKSDRRLRVKNERAGAGRDKWKT